MSPLQDIARNAIKYIFSSEGSGLPFVCAKIHNIFEICESFHYALITPRSPRDNTLMK